jgi:large subunit ribosomal protein L40e
MPKTPQESIKFRGRSPETDWDARGRLAMPKTPQESIKFRGRSPETDWDARGSQANSDPAQILPRPKRCKAPKRRRTWPIGAHPPTKQIQVITLTGKTITIDAEDTDNNMITKHKIEFKTGLPIDEFHLLVNGKQWEDDKSTIYEHNIRKDDTVRMGAGLRAGMKILWHPFQRGTKRPRIANEASLIYGVQGIGYRI